MLRRFTLFIALALLFTSCSNAEKSPEPAVHSGQIINMRARGYSLPIALEDIAVGTVMHVTDSPVLDIAFISDDLLAAVDYTGSLYSCSISTQMVTKLEELEESPSWSLTHAGDGRFLVWNKGDDGDYVCLDLNGEELWRYHYECFGGSPVMYSDLLFIPHCSQGNNSVAVLDQDGNVMVLINGSIGLLPSLIASPQGVIVLDSQGPHLLKLSGSTVTVELWNEIWDQGLARGRNVFLDAANRLISHQLASDEVVILAGTSNQPRIFNAERAFQQRSSSSTWQSNPSFLASNGDSLAILSESGLYRFKDGAVETWVDNLDDLINATCPVSDFFIDRDCEAFIVLQSCCLAYGNERSEIIAFNQVAIGDLEFSQNYNLAAIGFQNGDIIIFNIQ